MPAADRVRAPLVPATKVVGAAVLGVVLAVLGTYAHLLVVGSGRWPVGVVLAIVLTASGSCLLRALGPPPLGAVAAVAGWLLVVLQAASTRREGDLVIVDGGRGLTFLGLAMVSLVVPLVVPVGRRARPAVRVGS